MGFILLYILMPATALLAICALPLGFIGLYGIIKIEINDYKLKREWRDRE